MERKILIINPLMFKMTNTCYNHGNAELVGFVDGVLVAEGSAGLDDGGDPCGGSNFYAVGEGEEGV